MTEIFGFEVEGLPAILILWLAVLVGIWIVPSFLKITPLPMVVRIIVTIISLPIAWAIVQWQLNQG